MILKCKGLELLTVTIRIPAEKKKKKSNAPDTEVLTDE